MSKKKSSVRARTARRAETRASDKLTRAREQLFSLEPGGNSERPIDVTSSALVEPRAMSLQCPRCDVAFRVEAHNAPSVDGMRLREAVVCCPRCGQRRSLWFRLTGPSAN